MESKKKFLLLPALIIVLVLTWATTGIAAEDTQRNTPAEKTGQIKSLFNDVAATNNNILFINYLADLKIISGYPDGSYHPQEGLTRAQAAVVLVKAAGLDAPAVEETGFNDVGADHWAANSIAAASKAGFLKGYPDGSYQPEEKLTRAQGIALVMRLCTQKERPQLPVLKDMDQNHWAAGDMAVALAAGMIGLSSDNSQVYPEAAMTRGGLARALGTLLTKDSGLYYRDLAGTVKEIKGEIKLTRQGKTTSLQNDDPVYAGDTITSGANSTASIHYSDGSSVLIKENSEINIKESAGRACIKQDGSSGVAVDNVDIDLKKGTLFGALATRHEGEENMQAQESYPLLASLDGWDYLAESQSAKNAPWYQQAEAKKVKMKVDMPWGVASIRGTFILVSVNQDGSCDVSCLTGDAEVSGNSGNAVSLGGGQSSGVNQAGTAQPAAPMDDNEKEQFSSVQQWVVNTALEIDQNIEAIPPTVVEIVLEIPDQPAAPPAALAEEVKKTIEVVLDAIKSSGIQLTEQTKTELENKFKEIQKLLETLETIETQESNTNQSNSGVNGGTEESSSVSYINYATAGTYGPQDSTSPQSISKNIIVSSRDITLQNMIITKNLTLAAGIGDGSVTLINVTVRGNTEILGGGPNSVILEDCELYTVTVDNKTNTVRIVAIGNTAVGALTLNSGAELEEDDISGPEGGFTSVTTGPGIPPGATIVLSGNFAAVNIQAPDLTIRVAEGSIESINISPDAGGTALTLAAGVSVSTLQVDAAASIGGAGTIVTASINASSVVMEQVPSNLNVSEGVTNASVGGQTVSSGNTQIVTEITIDGADAINIPASGEITESYSAEVTDQNRNPIEGAEIDWSLLPGVEGVSIDENGELTVSSDVEESCTITIVATSSINNNISDQFEVDLVYQPAVTPVVTAITIDGANAINIPDSGTVTENYSVEVTDQNGNPMSEEGVNWSLLPGADGVSINENGELTVSSNVEESCTITIVATSNSNPSITDQLQVSLVASSLPGGNIEGYVINALDGSHVPGITINFYAGEDNTSGDVAATVTTDNNGAYSVTNLPPGIYTGEIIGSSSFSGTTFIARCESGTTTSNPNATVTPILATGETRIVLTWAEYPRDLDAYLTGPGQNQDRFKIFYGSKTYSVSDSVYTNVYAALDYDVTSGGGPETTTIYYQDSGDYIFSVHNYSGSPSLYQSQAVVKVYRGDQSIATFNVPTEGQAGYWWTVFIINGDTITPVNYISNDFEAGVPVNTS